MPHDRTCNQPPDGVLACGCTTDVIDRLYEQAGIKPGSHLSPDLWATIEAHVAPQLGPFEGAIHDGGEEAGACGVSVDLLVHRPSPERPAIDVVTAGMSAKRMRPPRALRKRGAPARAELMLSLPPEWARGMMASQAILLPDRIWVVQCLRVIARIPHEFDAFLGDARDLPIEFRCMPLMPFAECPFDAVLVADPTRFGHPMPPLTSIHPGSASAQPGRSRPSRDRVRFLSLVPLFARELDFAADHGVDRLLERLRTAGVTEVVDPDRDAVV